MKKEHEERLQTEKPEQREARHDKHRAIQANAKDRKVLVRRFGPKVMKRNTEVFGCKLLVPISNPDNLKMLK